MYPAHFTLLPAHCSSNDICILCSARDSNCTPISKTAANLRHLLSGKAGGLKKERSVIVQPLCVIASKPTWGAVLCVYCFCPVRVIPPSLCLSAAYRCYAHYLKIEVSQSHPVMKAFCGMLLQSVGQERSSGQKSRDAEEGL